MINHLFFKTMQIFLQKGICVVFCFFTTLLFAQEFSSDYWHQGTIVLKQGDTIQGPLKYNLSQNILLFQKKERYVSYNCSQVLAFSFFDVLDSIPRHFSSQQVFINEQYQIEMFFELLLVGNQNLFGRERIQLSRQAAMASQGFLIPDYELGFDYYYLSQSGLYLQPIRNTRKGLYALFGKYKDEMKSFMKSHKIHYSHTPKKQMIQLFNHLQELRTHE